MEHPVEAEVIGATPPLSPAVEHPSVQQAVVGQEGQTGTSLPQPDGPQESLASAHLPQPDKPPTTHLAGSGGQKGPTSTNLLPQLCGSEESLASADLQAVGAHGHERVPVAHLPQPDGPPATHLSEPGGQEGFAGARLPQPEGPPATHLAQPDRPPATHLSEPGGQETPVNANLPQPDGQETLVRAHLPQPDVPPPAHLPQPGGQETPVSADLPQPDGPEGLASTHLPQKPLVMPDLLPPGLSDDELRARFEALIQAKTADGGEPPPSEDDLAGMRAQFEDLLQRKAKLASTTQALEQEQATLEAKKAEAAKLAAILDNPRARQVASFGMARNRAAHGNPLPFSMSRIEQVMGLMQAPSRKHKRKVAAMMAKIGNRPLTAADNAVFDEQMATMPELPPGGVAEVMRNMPGLVSLMLGDPSQPVPAASKPAKRNQGSSKPTTFKAAASPTKPASPIPEPDPATEKGAPANIETRDGPASPVETEPPGTPVAAATQPGAPTMTASKARRARAKKAAQAKKAAAAAEDELARARQVATTSEQRLPEEPSASYELPPPSDQEEEPELPPPEKRYDWELESDARLQVNTVYQ